MVGISLEHFCVQQHLKILSVQNNPSSNAVFNSFFPYERKQDAATTAEHSKNTI